MLRQRYWLDCIQACEASYQKIIEYASVQGLRARYIKGGI
jgi:hypothetical protein